MRFLKFMLVLIALAGCVPRDGENSLQISVMTFNAWGAGANAGESVDQTVEAIRFVAADIVGLQEVRRESADCDAVICPPDGPSVVKEIAARLGYHYHEQQQENAALWANAILSKYPIERVIADDLGVVVIVGSRRIALINVHLSDFPYQPYQLLGIAYADAPFMQTEKQAIRAAKEARGDAVELVLSAVESLQEIDAVFVTGDFNEPSHRDWSERAAAAGRHPISVRFPSVGALEAVGFVDAYRSLHSDELEYPGYTWTPTSAADDPDDHHDRIDYVLVRGAGVKIESASVAGENASMADIVVSPWPSDHRAVVVTATIQSSEKSRSD